MDLSASPLALSEGDLRTTVRGAFTAVMPHALRRGVELSLSMPHRPLVACLDHPRIGDTVHSILLHAVMCADEGDALGVSVETIDHQVRVAIADPDRPPDRLLVDVPPLVAAPAHLRGPFHIVEAHGGRLHADGPHAAFWVPFVSLGMPCGQAGIMN